MKKIEKNNQGSPPGGSTSKVSMKTKGSRAVSSPVVTDDIVKKTFLTTYDPLESL